MLGFSLQIRHARACVARVARCATTRSVHWLNHQHISPQIFNDDLSKWQISDVVGTQRGLHTNILLKLVSWNINFGGPHPADRVAVILDYLRHKFDDHPKNLIIMFQEVCQQSALQILSTEWVQKHFATVGIDHPRVTRNGIPRPSLYFTCLLVYRHLGIDRSFRMSLPSDMGRDALFLDLAVCSPNLRPDTDGKKVLRLCTTHLESLSSGFELRRRQLESIALMLKQDNVVAGLVAGDMNAINDKDHDLHTQFDLKDAWEDKSSTLSSGVDTDESGSSSHLKRGHTWGYQSPRTKWPTNRLDKMMYTGAINTVPLTEFAFGTASLALLGVGLTAPFPVLDQSTPKSWATDHVGIGVGVRLAV